MGSIFPLIKIIIPVVKTFTINLRKALSYCILQMFVWFRELNELSFTKVFFMFVYYSNKLIDVKKTKYMGTEVNKIYGIRAWNCTCPSCRQVYKFHMPTSTSDSQDLLKTVIPLFPLEKENMIWIDFGWKKCLLT